VQPSEIVPHAVSVSMQDREQVGAVVCASGFERIGS
jgi:hypothetical protein